MGKIEFDTPRTFKRIAFRVFWSSQEAHAGQFKRDYKREAKGNHRKTLSSDLEAVLKLLIADEKPPAKYFDPRRRLV